MTQEEKITRMAITTEAQADGYRRSLFFFDLDFPSLEKYHAYEFFLNEIAAKIGITKEFMK